MLSLFRLSPLTVLSSVLGGNTSGIRNLGDCRPEIVEILVTGTQDDETTTIAWIPNDNCDPPFLYITQVATCETPQSSPSTQCRVDSATATHAVINNNDPNCRPGFSLSNTQPVLFRVQTGPDEFSPNRTSYIYTSKLNITGTYMVTYSL